MTQQVTRKQTEITATAIYKVTTKATGLTCWAVPSDSTNEMYTCCWDEQATRWTCTCKAGQNGMMCKHVRAVQTSILANKEASRKEASQVTPDVEIASERAAYLASTHQTTTDTISHIEEENQPQPIHDGYYTVSFENEHRTFRIRTQPQDADFAPGKQIIAFLSGSNNEADYTGFGFVSLGQLLTWKRFRYGYEQIQEAARFLLDGDHTEAGKMYAQESGNCYVCNRLLTTPESIAAGIGPVCASRVGVAVATPLGGYDIVGEAQRIVNAEIVAQKVGDSYSRDPRIEMSERDEAETRRINFELGMGY